MEERHFTHAVEFDRDGRLLLTDGTPARERSSGTVTYRRGVKVRIFDVPPEFIHKPNTSFGHSVEGHEGFYSANGCARSETLYDANDRPAELRLLNRRGRVLSRVVFKRDDSGRVIEERQRGSGGMPLYARLVFMLATRRRHPLDSSRHYSYDESGRRTEVRSGLSILGEDRETFEYNERGDVAVQRTEHVSRTFSFDWLLRRKLDSEQRHESEAHFEYKYDARGNWVEQTVRSANSESPASRYVRTITYWE